MTAEIVQFIPKPNPNRPTLVEDAEIKAAEFLNKAPALIGESIPYNGSGIDGMNLDTDKDSA